MRGEIIVLKHTVLECLMSLVPANIYLYLAVMFVTCNIFQFSYPHTHTHTHTHHFPLLSQLPLRTE